MARRKANQEHANHERWLVSYADFITLLFAFFVVMFASSQTDKGAAGKVSQSVKKAIGENHMAALVNVIMGGTVSDTGKGNASLKGPGGQKKDEEKRPDRQLAELAPSMKVLSSVLKNEIDGGKIKVSMEQRGLVVSFKEATLFASGEDLVAGSAFESIARVAEAIKKLPNPVRLEGHTDSIPIHTGRFRNNWDLSAARSIALLELMSSRYGVPTDRMSIGGYADSAPISSNDTLEGRARNRRCDIIVLNQAGAMAEPQTHALGASKTSPVASAEPQTHAPEPAKSSPAAQSEPQTHDPGPMKPSPIAKR